MDQGTLLAYGEGEAEAEELAEAATEEALAEETLAEETLAEETLAEETLAEETLAEETLAEEAPAEAAVAEETPVGPALMVRTTEALGRASVPEAGSVSVTVPGSSWLFTVLMAATV